MSCSAINCSSRTTKGGVKDPDLSFHKTEYWKSNARKYCDFCKCWLADNKISISYHENGKRHKENVQKHIAQLTKKSAKDHKQQMKIDDEMKKMEEAAMAAYIKDVQNNADLTSQNLNKMLDSKACSNATKDNAGPSASVEPSSDWLEVSVEDGNVYYWNQDTNETTWEPPDKYISLDRQNQEEKNLKLLEKSNERLRKEKQAEKAEELKAFVKREKMKEKSVKKAEAVLSKPDTFAAGPVCGPAPRANPYGTWAPIPEKTVETVDLQLPKTDKQYVPVPVIIQPEIIRFKEKKVDSLGEGQVDFKKRKLNSNVKRNMRRKVDDD